MLHRGPASRDTATDPALFPLRGNSRQCSAAVIQCLPYIGFPAAIKALRIIKEEYAR